MRIIAGQYRGRKLLGPRDAKTTRPLTDRVKQSLCDRLEAHGYFEAGVTVDVFSGTGSFGIEALSRGAAHAVFVDRDREAVERLERNLTDLGLSDRATICHMSGHPPAWLHRLPTASGHDHRLSVVMLDPPYALVRDPQGLNRIVEIIHAIEHFAHPDPPEPPEAPEAREAPEAPEAPEPPEVPPGPEPAPQTDTESEPGPDLPPPGTAAVLRLPLQIDAPPMAGWRGPREDRLGRMKLAYYVFDPAETGHHQ